MIAQGRPGLPYETFRNFIHRLGIKVDEAPGPGSLGLLACAPVTVRDEGAKPLVRKGQIVNTFQQVDVNQNNCLDKDRPLSLEPPGPAQKLHPSAD